VDECGLYRNPENQAPDDGQSAQASGGSCPPCAQGTWPSCEHYCYRHSPGCGKGYVVLAWLLSVAGLVVAIYGLVNGIVFRGFHLHKDWSTPSSMNLTYGSHNWEIPPLDPTDAKSKLVVYALVFRSAPVYISGLFTGTVVEYIDINMRFMQPFVNMFEKPGNAADTVLLAYITTSPLQVPITAIAKGHYRVALFSTLNTLAPLFPIFVGGLISLTSDDDTVIFTFSLSAYIGVMIFLIAWSLAFPFAWPYQARLLPRQFYSMADLICMCWASNFLRKPYLDIADPKRTPSKEIMEARILLSGDRFLFGHYTDEYDRLHIGFDVHSSLDHDTGRVSHTHLVKGITPAGELTAMVSQTRRTMTRLGGFGRMVKGGAVKQNFFWSWLSRVTRRKKSSSQEGDELQDIPPIAPTTTGLEAQQTTSTRQRAGGSASSPRAV
jgi:hypothetical protein